MHEFPQIPKKPMYLYKYCSASRAAQICRDLTFYFAPVGQLNDLYEFRVKSLYTESPDSKYRVYAKRLLAESWCTTSDEAIELARGMPAEEVDSAYQYYLETLTAMLERTMAHSGVTCFSSERNNQRMWGTYGENHAGVCIEFDTAPAKSKFAKHLMPVLYLDSKLPVCPSALATDELTLDQYILGFFCCMKHVHWSDEREWRLLLLADSPQSVRERLVPFEASAISRIFLGPRISHENEVQIRDAVAAIGPHVGVYKRDIDSIEAKEQFVGVEQIESLEQLLYWSRSAGEKNNVETPDDTNS